MYKNIAIITFCMTLFACGGSSDSPASDTTSPTLSAQTPANNSVITNSTVLVYTFNESLDAGGIVLTGTLASESDGGVLSTTTNSNDTLTISPSTTWQVGVNRTLNISVSDLSGNAITALERTYSLNLIFSNGQAAEVAIGQINLTTNVSNNVVSASTVKQPYGKTVYANGHLYLNSTSYHRFAIYNDIPVVSGASADSVLGQVDLDSDISGTSSSIFNLPIDIDANTTQLFIAEYNNNRVSIYPDIPTTGPTNTSVIIGQTDNISKTSGCTASTLQTPYSVSVTDNKVVVADYANNRVLIWNSIPTTDGEDADIVIGQNSMTNCLRNDSNGDGVADVPTGQTLSAPTAVWTDGEKLIVVEEGNVRILIWNTFPTTNFQAADVVLGQPDFTTVNATGTSATKFNLSESGLDSNGEQICLADTGNHRVLIWNSFPTTSNQAADVVLGQADFTSNGIPVVSATALTRPQGCSFIGNQLFASDWGNNRVLIYNSQ